MKNRKPAVNFIFVTALIDIIGFGIIIPVLPKLLAEINNIEINEASIYGGYLITAFAIAQFLFSPLMGSLSDQFGRRPIILISLFGFAIDYLILAFAPTFAWLLIGRVIAGLCGASFTTASAYIADISTDENRAKNFGMLGAAFGVGFVIGPFMGGVLGEYGVRVPFYAASFLVFINFLYGLFILPESLAVENRRKFQWRDANPVKTLLKISKYKSIGFLLLAYFLINLGSHAVQSNWTFFTMYKFEWSEATVGYSLAFVGLVAGVVQAVLAQKAANYFGEAKSIIYGFLLYTMGMFLFAIAWNGTWLMIFLVPYCLGGIAMPNLQSLLVSNVSAKEQGELQGGLTSLVALTTIFGPIIMTSIFYAFTKDDAPVNFPGAAFVLGGVLMLASFLVTLKLLKPSDEDFDVSTSKL